MLKYGREKKWILVIFWDQSKRKGLYFHNNYNNNRQKAPKHQRTTCSHFHCILGQARLTGLSMAQDRDSAQGLTHPVCLLLLCSICLLNLSTSSLLLRPHHSHKHAARTRCPPPAPSSLLAQRASSLFPGPGASALPPGKASVRELEDFQNGDAGRKGERCGYCLVPSQRSQIWWMNSGKRKQQYLLLSISGSRNRGVLLERTPAAGWLGYVLLRSFAPTRALISECFRLELILFI